MGDRNVKKIGVTMALLILYLSSVSCRLFPHPHYKCNINTESFLGRPIADAIKKMEKEGYECTSSEWIGSNHETEAQDDSSEQSTQEKMCVVCTKMYNSQSAKGYHSVVMKCDVGGVVTDVSTDWR